MAFSRKRNRKPLVFTEKMETGEWLRNKGKAVGT